jgi:Na+/H+-dicarboxylate symporters
MKVWVKLLIGSILGMAIGFLMPAGNADVISFFQWLQKLAIDVGRYAVVPVLVFSLTIAVYELRQDNQFIRMILKNSVIIAAAAVFVIFSGIIVTMIVSPGRIPIEKVEQVEMLGLDNAASISEIFPSNMLSVLTGSGIYLLPVCVFAFFLGMGLNYNRSYSKPILTMIDALSRIFYHIAFFFSEVLGFILIVLSSYWAVCFHGIIEAKVYKDLIVMLGIFSVILCFGILPLFLYILKPKVNPWHVLYGFLGPAITAFFSGDINFTIPVLQSHLKENFGIKRRSSALSTAIFSTFCRSGSAMVAAAAFIVIIKSYSYLRIAPLDIFAIGLRALLISFLLARHPGDGAYIALAALCLGYGSGEYRAGYLILKPLAFYLVAIGTFIDVTLGALGSYVAARTSGFIEENNLVRFI